MKRALPRVLAPNQNCQVWIHTVDTGARTLLFETDDILLEAPNWHPKEDALILNGGGTLWLLPVESPALHPIHIGGIPPLNNDHVPDPDGNHIFMSAYDDWQIYRAPLAGGAATRVTDDDGLMHFLHGVSPDGGRLAFVALRFDESVEPRKLISAEIFTVGADGRGYGQITHAGALADGPEYSPDGQWIYFNTEAFSGHAQIARMRPDGSDVTRLSFSETVDWFPHLAPNGQIAVYLAYPPSTEGHPADRNVELMLVRDGRWNQPERAARLFGGQGTINVNSWAPDSSRFAYVAYPMK